VKEVIENLTIGAFAKAAGVNVETVRFYQRKGLLLEPRRPHGSIRRYGGPDIARLKFVKSAQRLGFSLDQIGELLKLEDGSLCRVARGIAERRLADVRAKLSELNRIESALAKLVRQCGASRGAAKCALIGSLQRSSNPESSAPRSRLRVQ